MTPLFVQEVSMPVSWSQREANLNAKSRRKHSDHRFAYNNYLEGIKYLLSRQCRSYAMNNDGRRKSDVAGTSQPELVNIYVRQVRKRQQNNSSDTPEDAGWSREIRP